MRRKIFDDRVQFSLRRIGIGFWARVTITRDPRDRVRFGPWVTWIEALAEPLEVQDLDDGWVRVLNGLGSSRFRVLYVPDTSLITPELPRLEVEPGNQYLEFSDGGQT